MTPSTTPSTRRLSDVAQHLIIPEGIVRSNWPAVERRLAAAGVEFDLWQQGFAAVSLGYREDGRYAATVGGVVASIPRQVGKTFTVGNLLVGMAAEFPGLRVTWTSHHNRTTTNTFRSMQGLLKREGLAGLIAPNGIRTANGEQEIRFTNGSIIMFGAREHGFGRGLDGIDIVVLDEAQILSLKALEDMVPSTNQSRHPFGALVFFIGTPPRPGDDGEAFTAKRLAAIEGRTADQVYVEIAADEDAASDDRAQWVRMNPSYPHRTPLESMLRMRENMPDEMSWRREAMGIWPVSKTVAPIDMDVWSSRATDSPPADGLLAYGLDMTPDRKMVALGAALKPSSGPVHLEVAAHESSARGTSWAVDWLVERWPEAAAVVVDAHSPAMALVPALMEHKVAVTVTNSSDMARACGMVADAAVADGKITHFGQHALDAALAGAKKRNIGQGGGWGWDRRGTDVDLSPLVAVTLAYYGVMTSKRRPGRRSRVVVS